MRRLCSVSIWLAILVYASSMGTSWAQGRRVALLVGNQNYNPGRLAYPLQDVEAIRQALSRIGFASADIKVLSDAKLKDLRRAIQEFGLNSRGAEVAFFYYSGHAAQAQGQNWLIPIDALIQTEAGYELEAVSVQATLGQIVAADPKVGVVVLDACRDNPIAVRKSGVKGILPVLGGRNTLIAFATAPNETAADNGVYAKVLAAELQKPGVELLDVFRNTTSAVKRQTQNQQIPRISEVTLGSDERIYLAGQGVWRGTESDQRPSGNAGNSRGSDKACPECPETVLLEPGSFQMGSPRSEAERGDDEGPVRQVRIGYRLAVGKTHVSKGEFAAFVNATGYRTEAERGDGCFGRLGSDWTQNSSYSWRKVGFEQGSDHPVVCVSWNDAQKYIGWLNERSPVKGWRLLSEAEYEYAARAGTTTPFYTGQTIMTDQANFNGNSTYNGSAKGEYRKGTVRGGSFAANAWGLNDMAGNAWSWTQDCFASSYDGAPADGSAVNSSSCSQRVLRGGSWSSYPQGLRSAKRNWYSPVIRFDFTGFRLARTF